MYTGVCVIQAFKTLKFSHNHLIEGVGGKDMNFYLCDLLYLNKDFIVYIKKKSDTEFFNHTITHCRKLSTIIGPYV